VNPASNSDFRTCVTRSERTSETARPQLCCKYVRLSYQFEAGFGIVKRTPMGRKTIEAAVARDRMTGMGRSRGRNGLNLVVTYIWWKEPRN
jgi:hypothetical protein